MASIQPRKYEILPRQKLAASDAYLNLPLAWQICLQSLGLQGLQYCSSLELSLFDARLIVDFYISNISCSCLPASNWNLPPANHAVENQVQSRPMQRPQLLSRIIVSLIAKPYAVYTVRLCETIESHNLETIESETNIQGKRWILPVTDVKSC